MKPNTVYRVGDRVKGLWDHREYEAGVPTGTVAAVMDDAVIVDWEQPCEPEDRIIMLPDPYLIVVRKLV